ncbi:MAG: CCA tRNA nucleotidyltransferase [Candidatus Nanoarchaeia archaeon]|nr:CCA tRNA nucleotidyltransferase [Candidatus Nanoarchaeia archaeon]MDD5239293.1 CCA tRNA nucleotidyltransferase [Candidatus Nanoarchaeia archaeon]
MISREKAEYICKKVLKQIVPTEAEIDKLNTVINFAKKAVEDELKKQSLDADVVVGGSIGKNTWLRETHDVDIFVRFSTKYPETSLGGLLGNIIKSVFPTAKITHGSRDYYQLCYKGYDFDFVPVLKIDKAEFAKNSMDASPFHIAYVRNHSRINNIADQIRLFKAFAKAQGVYGAESYISGLSGYVSELLVIKYGGFLNMLEAFENLQPKILIDIEKHYGDANDVFKLFSESKLSSPMIVIDPVMKARNAAAAMNYKTFSVLLFAIRKFLREPSEEFFVQKPQKITALEAVSRKRGTLFIKKEVKQTEEKDDIFFSKLKKKVSQIHSELERQGIEVYDYGFLHDKGIYVYFEIATLELSKYQKHYGPPVWVPSDNFDAFIDKYKDARPEDTNLVVDVKRESVDVKTIVLKVLKEGLADV